MADHRETEPFLFSFFFPPFLILIKGPVQDKQCLPTLQFKQRGPLRPKRWFLNVHWQVGLICVLSRWRWTYIYLSYSACTPLSRYFSTSCETLWHFSAWKARRSSKRESPCCLVYICHAVLKVRTAPAAETWAQASSGSFTLETGWPWLDWEAWDAPDSLIPARLQPVLGRYSCGHCKTLSLCGHLSTAERLYNSCRGPEVNGVQVAELLSQHYNYIAPMIQLHYEVTWRPRSHDAVTLGKCQRQKRACVTQAASVRRSELTLRWPWLRPGGQDSWWPTWMSLYMSRPLRASQPLFACCGEQSMPDKGRQLARETSHYEEEFGTVSLTMGQTKGSVVLSPVGGVIISFFFFCGAFVMDNCPPHMIS